MQDKKLIVLIGLAALAVLSLVYGILTPSKAKRQVDSSAGMSSKEAVTRPANLFPAERQTRSSTHAIWGRSPFLPKGVKNVSAPRHLALSGISWDAKVPRAVINDRIVRVGDQVAGNKIVKIERNRVVLNDGVAEFELKLGRKK